MKLKKLFGKILGPAFADKSGSATINDSVLKQHFDSEFYLKSYPDVAAAGVDPLAHYIEFGWREMRAPFSNFDVKGYVETHMNGDQSICPLVHYVTVTLQRDQSQRNKENTSDLSFEACTYEPPNASEAQREFLRWYKEQDAQWVQEMFRLLDALGVDTSSLSDLPLGRYIRSMFSPEYYRNARGIGPEVDDNECFIRYIAFGLPAGLAPGPLFHEPTYRRRVAEAKLPPIGSEGPFVHWMRYGLLAEISPSPLFSTNSYLELNHDLENYPGPKTAHFLLHGLDERRQFSADALIVQSPNERGYNGTRIFFEKFGADNAAHEQLGSIRRFKDSHLIQKLARKSNEIEPEITTNLNLPSFVPPWHDAGYLVFKRALDLLPPGKFHSVVLLPFCKVGGADYVAGILSRTLLEIDGPVLVIQTDQDEWARPDWFGDVERVDLSLVLQGLDITLRTRILYEILRRLRPEHVFNVNSNLAFQTFQRFGKQLARFTKLHAYFFCADRMPNGDETGYPVWYFSHIFAHLTSAITDSRDLTETLIKRFSLPAKLSPRVSSVYTPSKIRPTATPIVLQQVETSAMRRRSKLIWAGRFDRQKRFDLLIDVARILPDIDFLCWGKAVLDAPPDLTKLGENVSLYEPFTSYDELPLEDVDGFFYTSDWDGIPTILIELGSLGMPIVASAAGGVPELIDETTGWPVSVGSKAKDYARMIEKMLDDPADRVKRALALRNRVLEQHSEQHYANALKAILKGR